MFQIKSIIESGICVFTPFHMEKNYIYFRAKILPKILSGEMVLVWWERRERDRGDEWNMYMV